MLTTTSSMSNDAFINSCLATVAHLIPVSAGVFYLVNDDLMPEHYVLQGVSEETHHQYLSHFQAIDPLHPAQFNRHDVTIVGINQSHLSSHAHYYYDFMLPNGMQDMTEIFIRQRKRIVAGISLIRDRPFTDKERSRLLAALPLLELATLDLLPETPPRLLTAKEQEIVNLVREGASNKRIALRLGISLSTVKTHMRNIFAKTNVMNRTELVSAFYMNHG